MFCENRQKRNKKLPYQDPIKYEFYTENQRVLWIKSNISPVTTNFRGVKETENIYTVIFLRRRQSSLKGDSSTLFYTVFTNPYYRTSQSMRSHCRHHEHPITITISMSFTVNKPPPLPTVSPEFRTVSYPLHCSYKFVIPRN